MARTDPMMLVFRDWMAAFMRLSMRGMIQYMKQNDLSISQVGALFEIKRGSTNVSDVGEALGVSIAAASQMLDRLVQLGLVTRTEDRADRRVKKLVLTDKGRRILQESVEARQGWLEDLVAALSPAEKEQVSAAIKVMTHKTQQLDQEPQLER